MALLRSDIINRDLVENVLKQAEVCWHMHHFIT
jgi:hypothetical protein